MISKKKLNINVLCGSGGCEATAEELEDNPPAAVIAGVINEAIENGSFSTALQTNAAESCDGGCDELEGAKVKPVTVVAGPLVLNTLSPSVSPTSSSPTTKSVRCCQFKVLSAYITFVHNISHILIAYYLYLLRSPL